ncbi:MAG: hypothetical protein LUG66_07065 [Clostridiales bacterium]|nr:hypothetical protein [Clostridiales bacterium]
MNKFIYKILSRRLGAYFEIRILMRKTAEVFGVRPPKTCRASGEEKLKLYARFTASEVMRLIQSGYDINHVQQKLFNMAYNLGSSLRQRLKPKSKQECFSVIKLLYKNIGIVINEESLGKFCIEECFFSAYYTPETCAVISAADKGIFAGIYNGKRLSFSRRITEGYNECLANLTDKRAGG